MEKLAVSRGGGVKTISTHSKKMFPNSNNIVDVFDKTVNLLYTGKNFKRNIHLNKVSNIETFTISKLPPT